MAIGLENFPNITPADSDYPSGRIKDDTGANDGTPIDVETNGDIQEFFAKLMRLAGTTPNGLPDNEYTGHQYIDALQKIYTAGVIESKGGLQIKTAVYPLGFWNMSLGVIKNIPHGLNRTSIVSVNVLIYQNTAYNYPIDFFDVSSGLVSGWAFCSNTNINIDTQAGGLFRNGNFSSTSINRGYAIVTYLG